MSASSRRRAQLVVRWRLACAPIAETGQQRGRPAPRPRPCTTSKPSSLQRALPARGDDRHAVGQAEAERDDGAHGHRPMTVLIDRVRSVMEAHWQPEGYTVPNAVTYPFRWLWDSCFHALIWAELGERRPCRRRARATCCGRRTTTASSRTSTTDAIPHHHESFWGQPGASTITQPPMYGHAIAALAAAGDRRR